MGQKLDCYWAVGSFDNLLVEVQVFLFFASLVEVKGVVENLLEVKFFFFFFLRTEPTKAFQKKRVSRGVSSTKLMSTCWSCLLKGIRLLL